MGEREIGRVTHYFSKAGVAVLDLKEQLKKGDEIIISGATTSFEQVVESMQVEHKNMEVAEPGQEVALKVKEKVREGDTIYKKE